MFMWKVEGCDFCVGVCVCNVVVGILGYFCLM